MKILLSFSLLIALMGSSRTNARGEKAPSHDGFVYTTHPRGVIVPATRGSAYCGRRGASSFFTPTKSEISRLESRLPRFLKAVPGVTAEEIKRLSTYRRQYVGLILHGERLIWVNAFCEDFENWKTTPVLMTDGGECFFHVDFNTESGDFSKFGFNGES